MKRATIRGRRPLGDGRRLVNIVCPICDGRHWMPANTQTHECPRKPGTFTIPTERTTP